MITGMHAVIYSREAERAREFFRDILRLDSIDAGGGWLIFALPPSELAVHPTDGDGSHELFLVCDDVEQTTRELALKGVSTVEPITEQRWGRLTRLRLPSGDDGDPETRRHGRPHQRACCLHPRRRRVGPPDVHPAADAMMNAAFLRPVERNLVAYRRMWVIFLTGFADLRVMPAEGVVA